MPRSPPALPHGGFPGEMGTVTYSSALPWAGNTSSHAQSQNLLQLSRQPPPSQIGLCFQPKNTANTRLRPGCRLRAGQREGPAEPGPEASWEGSVASVLEGPGLASSLGAPSRWRPVGQGAGGCAVSWPSSLWPVRQAYRRPPCCDQSCLRTCGCGLVSPQTGAFPACLGAGCKLCLCHCSDWRSMTL